jgi:hypothetical protein
MLIFLVYYTYQKVEYDNDVIIPIKAVIIRVVPSVLEKSRLYTEQGLQEGAQLSHKLIWARFMTKPVPPVDRPTIAPKATPASDKTTTLAESSESKPEVESKPIAESAAAQESESSPSSTAATEPKATETSVSATPKAPVPSETPPPPAPTASEPPKPEPVIAPVKSPQDVEYERILQTCKQQQPKAGDRITLRFKNGRESVEGVFEQTTAEGVKIKVPAGVIEYPFRLVTEESRLIYFPEERARRIQRQQIKKSE